MGDTFKKVQSGDPLRIPAETFNTFIDAARDFKARRQSRTRESRFDIRQTGIIPVKNNSGADRNRFDILGIDRPIFTPDDSLTSFQNQVALVGVTPTEADHFGKFVVLLEPLRAGAIGQACVSGLCVVRLCVEDASHKFADVDDSNPAALRSGSGGAAFILWKETAGSGYGYCGYGYGYGGLVWAVVRIGNLSEVPATDWGLI